MIRHVIIVMVVSLLMTWSLGCCNDGDPIKINAELAETVQDSNQSYPLVWVDLVGVNPSEYPVWSKYSMTQYWDVDEPFGEHGGEMGVRLKVGDNVSKPLLDNDDPIWEKWKSHGVTAIFVLSSFPKGVEDQLGNADPRRNIIPLECSRWNDHKPSEVKITISKNGVSLNPAPPEQSNK